MLDLLFVHIRLSEINEFMANCVMILYDLPMSATVYAMSSEEIKAWVLSRDPLRCELPIREQIVRALQDLGLERIRLNQVEPHPVWNVSAKVGQFRADSLRSVKLAIKKMCDELGFKVRMNEIVASVYRGRLNAAFGLISPDMAPIEVEDDGHRVPDHLDFEDAA
jgi:hypothetical protein